MVKKRGRGIGGSDAACFMDLNPWKTLNQLWHDKNLAHNRLQMMQSNTEIPQSHV